jgi:hypothetical protein
MFKNNEMDAFNFNQDLSGSLAKDIIFLAVVELNFIKLSSVY